MVRKKSVAPFTRAAYRAITASYQPVRRDRPVVTPNSPPSERSRSPTSSSSSVGNGPEPTRVVYALMMATTRLIRVGPMPEPAQAPPAVGFEDVTNGYVPWSTSSSVPCEPSSSTTLPAARARLSTSEVSAMCGASRSAKPAYSSQTAETSIARRL